MDCDAVLIAGPTASGKSALALQLAEAVHGAIINADSMQVYAEAPVLTAQPSALERARVPHLLYGHVSAREAYSVGRFAADAAAALAEVRAMGRRPIFVGGTGLYFMALTEGLADIPPVPVAVREAARALAGAIGTPALHARLAARDARTAARLRPGDTQRVLRAWEVLEATGRPLADWQEAPSAPVLKGLGLSRFVLNPPRGALRTRIAERFAAMMAQGGLAEAMALKDLDPALPAARLLGLRSLVALGEGRRDRAAALDEAITATRQFAKRQVTWFRHRMKDWLWLDRESNNVASILAN